MQPTPGKHFAEPTLGGRRSLFNRCTRSCAAVEDRPVLPGNSRRPRVRRHVRYRRHRQEDHRQRPAHHEPFRLLTRGQRPVAFGQLRSRPVKNASGVIGQGSSRRAAVSSPSWRCLPPWEIHKSRESPPIEGIHSTPLRSTPLCFNPLNLPLQRRF